MKVTREEVIEHFKNAKIVESALGAEFDYTLARNLHLFKYCWYVYDKGGNSRTVFSDGKFAEIISNKEVDKKDVSTKKVVCIKSPFPKQLTKNREYEVIGEDFSTYSLMSDDGSVYYFGKSFFEEVSKKETRYEKIARLESELEALKNEVPKINGYEMNYVEENVEDSYLQDYVEFGCARFPISFFKNIVSYNSSMNIRDNNRSIVSVKLSSGVEITAEDAENVVNFLKNS